MKQLIKRRRDLLRQLLICQNLVKGSINETCVNCNRSKCICKNKTDKKAYRLTYKDKNQKTVIIYIPKGGLKKIKSMIANYARCKIIIGQLIEVNLKIFKLKL